MTMEKIGIIGFTSEEERDYYRRMLTALGVQEQILFGEVLTRISLREHAKIMRFSEHSSLRSMVCEAEPHRDWLKKEAERMLAQGATKLTFGSSMFDGMSNVAEVPRFLISTAVSRYLSLLANERSIPVGIIGSLTAMWRDGALHKTLEGEVDQLELINLAGQPPMEHLGQQIEWHSSKFFDYNWATPEFHNLIKCAIESYMTYAWRREDKLYIVCDGVSMTQALQDRRMHLCQFAEERGARLIDATALHLQSILLMLELY